MQNLCCPSSTAGKHGQERSLNAHPAVAAELRYRIESGMTDEKAEARRCNLCCIKKDLRLWIHTQVLMAANLKKFILYSILKAFAFGYSGVVCNGDLFFITLNHSVYTGQAIACLRIKFLNILTI